MPLPEMARAGISRGLILVALLSPPAQAQDKPPLLSEPIIAALPPSCLAIGPSKQLSRSRKTTGPAGRGHFGERQTI